MLAELRDTDESRLHTTSFQRATSLGELHNDVPMSGWRIELRSAQLSFPLHNP